MYIHKYVCMRNVWRKVNSRIAIVSVCVCEREREESAGGFAPQQMFSILLLSDSVFLLFERFSVLPFFIMAQFAVVRHHRRFIVAQSVL